MKIDKINALRQDYARHVVSINRHDLGFLENQKSADLLADDWGNTTANSPYACQYALGDVRY